MVMNLKRAKIIAAGMATVFLLIHVMMIIMFYECRVWPMVRVNIFSILFYFVMLWVSYKGWLAVYAPAVFLEVTFHMSLAVIYTGWGHGFEITLIGMNVLAVYAEHVGRTVKIKYVKMLPFCFIGMAVYLGTFLYEHAHPAPYQLPDKVTFALPLLWGVIVFVIIIFILEIFVFLVNGSEAKLEYQMSHDKLTDLPNRYYLSQYFERIQKTEGFDGYWVAIADIDDFKKINDTYGHKCGDYVLSTIASLAQKEEDVLCCRWGGEEYIFMGKITDNINQVYKRLDVFRQSIESYSFNYKGYVIKVTMTIGLVAYEPGMTGDNWFTCADQKLYDGKHSGKNKVVL
jgi:diguanylate cyclase (GGDEF)-like protein